MLGLFFSEVVIGGLVISLLVTGDLGISQWKLVTLEAITLRQMLNYALVPLCLSAFMP
jgi:hypothetical protein